MRPHVFVVFILFALFRGSLGFFGMDCDIKREFTNQC